MLAALLLAFAALGAPAAAQATPLTQEATPIPEADDEATEPITEAEAPAPLPTDGPIETPGREAFAASSGLILGIGLAGLLFVLVALWAVYTTRQEKEQERQRQQE
jgi:hypothetical protein